jgi:hypothetical protein
MSWLSRASSWVYPTLDSSTITQCSCLVANKSWCYLWRNPIWKVVTWTWNLNGRFLLHNGFMKENQSWLRTMKYISQWQRVMYHGSQFYRTTTLPLYGKGLSPEFVYLSMGGLVSKLHGRTPRNGYFWTKWIPLTRLPGWAELEAPEREIPYPGL